MIKSSRFKVGEYVQLDKVPARVRSDLAEDDVFRTSVGRRLLILSIEENGDLELDVRDYDTKIRSIYVPEDCVSVAPS
jgi:hypothetical protein